MGTSKCDIWLPEMAVDTHQLWIGGMYIGTLLYTWLNGTRGGTDEFGNRYYRSKNNDQRYGRERRWCLYKGASEASKVPPEWHAWLHHTVEVPLTEAAAQVLPWQTEHQPNLPGAAGASRPRGHPYRGSKRAAATGDYEAWTPE